MDKFSITLRPIDPLSDIAEGELRIGDFRERFDSNLGYWASTDYERQWSSALERLRTGAGSAVFLTDMSDPATANFLRCWVAYREGADVYFQEQILFMEELAGPFDESEPWKHMGPRETRTDEGERISEWHLHWPPVNA